jgi:mono/diheme cytochrome c family protein
MGFGSGSRRHGVEVRKHRASLVSSAKKPWIDCVTLPSDGQLPYVIVPAALRDRRRSGHHVSRKAVYLVGLGGVAVAGCIALTLTYRAPIKSIARPDPRSFSVAEVQRGAILAAIGDCNVCHTAERGAPYAGGRPLPTPFGTLYSTNITPDETTGIGNWSRKAFRRAMRDGVARDGSHLYPALPYENYTRVNDVDLDAIYAFLMTRAAVRVHAPRNEMIFPLGFRPFLAGWKLLCLHKGAFAPNPRQSGQWNRGAYLVEGLGHCGGCHTPRNLLGGEEAGRPFAGGVAEGWNAPALDASNPSARTWTVESLFTYLQTGMDRAHSAAAGPMEPVTDDLSTVPEEDVRAIAVYTAFLMQASTQATATPVDLEQKAAREHPGGAALFIGACGGCHGEGAPMVAQGRPSLSQVSVIQETDPRNTLNAILRGIALPIGERGAYMPAFSDNLGDREIAEITAYLRARFSDHPTWPNLEKAVATARKGTEP